MPARIALLLAFATGLFAQQQSLEQAWIRAADGHRSEAIQLLHEIVDSTPGNADARLLLGSLLMEQGEKAQSIEQLSAAVRLRPQSEQAQNALGEAHLKFGDTAAARTAFEKAVALKPDDGIVQLNLGRVLLEQGDTAAAGKRLDRAIASLGRSDDAADAHYLLAKIYTAQNEAEQASGQLRQATRIRPNFAEAWSDLGQARKLLLDDAGALDAFERAVDANPNDAVAQYRLGTEYRNQEKAAAALEHLQKAYELNPTDQSTLNALQMTLRQLGDIPGANRVKQQLAELLRERDQTNQNKLAAVRLNNDGTALEKRGDLRAALAKYREASRLDPDHVGIRINCGVALLRLGNWTEGLEELHTALLRDPGNEQLRGAMKDALAQAPPSAIPKWPNEVP